MSNKQKQDKYYKVYGYDVPFNGRESGSVWVDGGTKFVGLFDAEITDAKWVENYKNNLHPNDDWTNVDVYTYGRWIKTFDYKEGSKLVDDAIKARVVGYLD